MRALSVAVLAVLVTLFASPASATEYRLRVLNLDDSAYFHFADPDGNDSASPFALRRLEPVLAGGTLPGGILVMSRELMPVPAGTARSFAAVQARPLGQAPTEGPWQELRWEGKPGERSVWVVRGEGIAQQGAVGVGLRASSGEFRHYIPFVPSPGTWKVRAARLGLDLVDFWYGRDGLWERYLGGRLDLTAGVAAVVAENPNAVYADSVFLVIEQPPTATTYDVVIAWRQRGRGHFNPYYEGPGSNGPVEIR